VNGNARNGTVGYIGATPPTINDGTVFSAGIALSPTGATPDFDNYEPEYVASDGAGQILVTFTYEPEDESFAKDLWVNYSGDFGATWNGPTRLTTSGENASEPNEDSSAAFLADGSVIVVWENEGTLVSGVKVPAYTVSSNGTTWPAEATYESAAPTATPAARTEDAQNPRVAAGSGVVGVFYSEEQDYDFGDGAIGTDNDVMAVFSGELDVDGDGTPDATDAFPNNPEGATDSDADGIGDEWEEKFFGDNDGIVEAGELDVANATSDFDGDGVLDIQEFEQGTDPTFAPPQVPVGGTAALAGLLALAGVVAIRRRR
jgi:MYXO-CTERM domain-containing protein